MAMVDDQSKTCVVIGGTSFVGKCLVTRLLKLGNWIVRVADSTQLDLSDHNLHPLSTDRSASYFNVDVRNKNSIINAIEGSSVVFYVDDDDSCNYDFLSGYTIIVQGVKNVISACRECKVRRLIYNSTADVVLDSSQDVHNGNETLLYATKFKNVYSELKAQAEALVLLASDIDGLLTCAVRPSNIFGPGDKQLLPSLVDVAKSSWAKFIIGSDGTMCDYTYVENVAHALICAEAALGSRMVIVSGKVFFITNLEPLGSWEFSLRMLEGLGYYRPMVKLPDVVVRLIVYLIKWMHSKTNSRNISNSGSVHYIVQLMSRTTTYDCSAAQQHIEYSPVVSMDEGVTSTIESFSHLAKDSSSVILDELYEQSKMEQLLGGGEVNVKVVEGVSALASPSIVLSLVYHLVPGHGLARGPLEPVSLLLSRGTTVYISPPPYPAYAGLGSVVVVSVAEILLWRDERKSFVCFCGVVSLFYWFFLCERTLISSIAQLLLVVIIFLYGYATLSHENPLLSTELSSYLHFEISETHMRSCARTIANTWNGVSYVFRTLAQGEDWSMFLKVVVSLYLFKLLLVNSFPTSLAIALGFSFIVFFVYEQYEEEIEGLIGILIQLMRQSVASVTSSLPNTSTGPSISKDVR